MNKLKLILPTILISQKEDYPVLKMLESIYNLMKVKISLMLLKHQMPIIGIISLTASLMIYWRPGLRKKMERKNKRRKKRKLKRKRKNKKRNKKRKKKRKKRKSQLMMIFLEMMILQLPQLPLSQLSRKRRKKSQLQNQLLFSKLKCTTKKPILMILPSES